MNLKLNSMSALNQSSFSNHYILDCLIKFKFSSSINRNRFHWLVNSPYRWLKPPILTFSWHFALFKIFSYSLSLSISLFISQSLCVSVSLYLFLSPSLPLNIFMLFYFIARSYCLFGFGDWKDQFVIAVWDILAMNGIHEYFSGLSLFSWL